MRVLPSVFRLLPLVLALAGLLPARPLRAQQLPGELLLDENYQHAPAGHYFVGGSAPEKEGALTPAGYVLRYSGPELASQTINPPGLVLNQRQDFVLEGELRGKGDIGLYWAGRTTDAGREYALVQFNLTLARPTVAVLQLQNGQWQTLATAPLPGAVPPADWHRVRIARTGPTLVYSVDGTPVWQQPWPNPTGHNLGLTLQGTAATVTIRRLRVWHPGLRLAPGVPAGLRRERLAAPGLNTEREEGLPLVSANGRFLYFSRVMGNPDTPDSSTGFDSDTYVAERGPQGDWGPAQSLGPPVNTTPQSNYPVYVAPDGQTLLVQGRYGTPSRSGPARTQRRADGTWTSPEPLPEGTGSRPDFGVRNNTLSLDASGTVLLRSAALQTNPANGDLYVSRRQPDGTWTAPVALPAPINTPGEESTPFLAPDGKTLFFSSDTHPGYGGEDVFVSTRLDDSWTKWSEPLNLGPAVNTAQEEIYFNLAAAGDYAYLVANVGDGKRGDIYRLALPPALRPAPTLLVRGRVLDALTRQLIATAEVRYEQLPSGFETGVVLPAAAGSFEVALPAGQLYGLRATAPGYLSVNESLDLAADRSYREVTQDLLLMPLAAPAGPAATEKKIALNNVFFVRGKPTLLAGSFPELNRLAATLQQNPGLRIRLDGHTDNTGDAKDPAPNQALSEQRVAAVKAFLVKRGVAADRLQTQGFGGSRPVAPNDSEEHKRLNRRVEFVILNGETSASK